MMRSVAASCRSQIQPTGNNPSLLPIHITLPLNFSEGYHYVSFPTVFSVVEYEYANSMDMVALAAEPVATMVATAWGFGLCQLSDMGKGQLNSEKTRISLIYCVVVCYLWALSR